MMKLIRKKYNEINGILFILPAVALISLFGIFPVFFAIYMSFHKWKVFKGRFLGFENYNRILGDIGFFWIFVFGLLLLIASYWLWSEFKEKIKNKKILLLSSLTLFVISIFIINYSWSVLMEKGDDDFLNALIYTFYY